MPTYRFKAGDTFAPAGVVALPVGIDWQGRAKVCDADGIEISECVVDVAPVDDEGQFLVSVVVDAATTNTWPRPSAPGASLALYCDYELFDPDGDTVISSETMRILVEFDPTVNNA